MDSDEIFSFLGFLMLMGIIGLGIYFAANDDGYWVKEYTVCTAEKLAYKCVKDTTGLHNEAVAFCETREECNVICKEYSK